MCTKMKGHRQWGEGLGGQGISNSAPFFWSKRKNNKHKVISLTPILCTFSVTQSLLPFLVSHEILIILQRKTGKTCLRAYQCF